MKYKKMQIKKFCVSVLIVLWVSIAQLALADTEVGGNIIEDTTWTKANSPYIVTNTMQVFEGVKLTINPGVTIKFDKDTGLTIGGELNAVGTELEIITFTSNSENPSPGDWGPLHFIDGSVDAIFDSNLIYSDGSIIKYCLIEYGTMIYNSYASPYISFCQISKNSEYGLRYEYTSNVIISNNIINDNKQGGISIEYCSGLVLVVENNITNNTSELAGSYGIFLTFGPENVIIRDNILDNNRVGVNLNGNAILEKNRIENNFTGVFARSNSIIKWNDITNNQRGICAFRTSNEVLIQENNFYGNIDYALYNTSEDNIDAKNNYWGTIETVIIDQQIYDYYDDITKGKFIYEPISTQAFDFSGGLISGIVNNSSTGNPIIEATISTNIGLQILSDDSGQYKIENISPGEYTLTVAAPLYHSSTVENVTVTGGETTTLNISLNPKTTGVISGQVISAEGLAPIENVTIQVSNGADSFTVNSDVTGDFTFADLTYGDYTIDLISDLYQGIPYSVTVNVDEITQVSLVGIPQSIVDDLRSEMYTQEQLNQAIAEAEAAKDFIIAEKNQIITDLNLIITSMFTQEQIDQAVLNEKQKWDINGDNKIGLEEAIHALQIISGTRNY